MLINLLISFLQIFGDYLTRGIASENNDNIDMLSCTPYFIHSNMTKEMFFEKDFFVIQPN